MNSKVSLLETYYLQSGQDITMPAYLPAIIHLDDSAMSVMIDYQQTSPVLAEPNLPMFRTRQLLEKESTQLALIMGEQQRLIGALSLQQILSEQTIKLIEENRIHGKEVATHCVMMPINQVPMLDMSQLKLAKVSHIIATLDKLKQPYLLVMESTGKGVPARVRGAFTISHISKMIGKPVFTELTGEHTVAELQHNRHQ